MRRLRRRLFWKVYLTLLASLVVVALLVGGFWSLVGEAPRDRWGELHVRLEDWNVPTRDDPPGTIAAALNRLGEAMGADITVYDANRTLVASRGPPVPLSQARLRPPAPPVVRVDLADGRAVLARLRAARLNPLLRLLSIIFIVAGGVAVAAFPITARLTRRLENLRLGVEQWGDGRRSLRVDDAGDDEVAVVAGAFNAAAARVERLLASQRALLANASHELRSPLARLRMAVELWSAQPSPEMQAEILRNLAESDQLVDEILLASRLEHLGERQLRAAPVDLLGLAAEEAAKLGPGLACVDGDEAVEVEGDATLLGRLIRNLLENAAKHGRPPVIVSVARHGGMARVVVSDQGDGVAAQERERVFEPFYRPSGRGESTGGWGLGLALVRQIAERHGGRAICEAAPQGGSCFVVELPARRREGASG